MPGPAGGDPAVIAAFTGGLSISALAGVGTGIRIDTELGKGVGTGTDAGIGDDSGVGNGEAIGKSEAIGNVEGDFPSAPEVCPALACAVFAPSKTGVAGIVLPPSIDRTRA